MSISRGKPQPIDAAAAQKKAIDRAKEQAELAFKEAMEAENTKIKIFQRLLDIKKVTHEDLSTDMTLLGRRRELKASYASQVEAINAAIQQAVKNKLKLQQDYTAKQNKIGSASDSSPKMMPPAPPMEPLSDGEAITRQPTPTPTIPRSHSFYTQQNQDPFREKLKKSLEAYIDRIQSYPHQKNEIHFAYGFIFMPQSRAINRQANYLLAANLLRGLNTNKSIAEVFSNINGQRDTIIRSRSLNKLEHYVNRGINSDTLNAIIKEAIKHIAPETQQSSLKKTV